MSSPVTKRSRSSESSNEGAQSAGDVIRIECDGFSTNADRGWQSRHVVVGGRLWSAIILRRYQPWRGNWKSFVSAYLTCNDNESMEDDIEYVIFNNDSKINFTKPISSTIVNGRRKDVWSDDIMEWEYAINEENGFVNLDKMVVEIHISISDNENEAETDINVMSEDIDFTNANDPRHDISFVMHEKHSEFGTQMHSRLYAGKQILSIHSRVFAEMLYCDCKNKKEIVLEDVDRDELLEMLRVIYPPTQIITNDNVHSLLKLGQRFQIKHILNLAEQHFIASSDHGLIEKMLLVEQYNLVRLKAHCFSTFKTLAEVRAFKKTAAYFLTGNLSLEMRDALFDRSDELS